MYFKRHLLESLKNLLTTKLRSILAVLGVLVGTGSVVALIASSQLATQHALSQFNQLGTNLLSLHIDRYKKLDRNVVAQELSLDDIRLMDSVSSEIVSSAPYISFYQPITIGGQEVSGRIIGATNHFQRIAKLAMTQGRFISLLDRNERFCVIGVDIAKIFKDKGINPIGKQVSIGNNLFTVVGVMAPWSYNLFLSVNINKSIVIPFYASYLLKSNLQVNDILFRLVKNPNLSNVQSKLKRELSRFYPEEILNFRNPQQIIDLMGKERRTFQSLLIAIGSIALFVGGIGVMNIMMVAVVERRREIGIRTAVGAKRRDILWMFLVESVVLTLFGGVLGILIGLSLTYVLAYLNDWGYYFYLTPLILGFGVSVIVGILSGLYPALRASKLDPIQCLTR